MAKVCQCRCNKAECIQCDTNVGYAIGKFFNDVKVVDASKVGTFSDGGKLVYTGKCEVENGGICDILMPVEKIDFDGDKFIPELTLQNGIKGTMSDYLQKWIDSNGGGGEKTLEALKMYEQGKTFVNPFKVGTTITPLTKEAKENIEGRNKIKAVTYKLKKDALGNLRQVLEVHTNVQVKGKNIFSADEFMTLFSVSGSTTKNTEKFVKMTDAGIIRPVCIKYPEFNILIDNVYVYIDDGKRTMPIGAWGAYSMMKNETMDMLLEKKKFKLVKDATECLGKLRKFIAPYWCVRSNIIIGE